MVRNLAESLAILGESWRGFCGILCFRFHAFRQNLANLRFFGKIPRQDSIFAWLCVRFQARNIIAPNPREIRYFKALKMLARSHITLGLLGACGLKAALPSEIIANEAFYGVALPVILIGSVFPDIDEPRSFIGRKLPVLSHIVSLSFSHRGFTHFLIFPLLLLSLGIGVYGAYPIIGIAIFALSYGIFMHQIGDMLTISGIPHYFFPLSKKTAVLLPKPLRFRTGGSVEKAVFACVLLPLVALAGMEEFDLWGSVDFETILKNIERLL